MKYQESYVGSKADFGDFVKKAVPDLFSGKLTVEGKTATIPGDTELEYKVKYDESEDGGSVSIKVTWENPNIELDLEE